MSRRIAIAGGVAIALALGSFALPDKRPIIWNASASVPTGLYAIRSKRSLHVGERVAIMPASALRWFLAGRGYLPTGVPLVKRIAAVAGQRVCRIDNAITIDGTRVGIARERDTRGRPLPTWSGCLRIGRDQLFVMNPAVPDSFDGRYFGLIEMRDVLGRATPIFTDERGDGRHVWFATPSLSAQSQQHRGDRL